MVIEYAPLFEIKLTEGIVGLLADSHVTGGLPRNRRFLPDSFIYVQTPVERIKMAL
jgi:hypothetical protein